MWIDINRRGVQRVIKIVVQKVRPPPAGGHRRGVGPGRRDLVGVGLPDDEACVPELPTVQHPDREAGPLSPSDPRGARIKCGAGSNAPDQTQRTKGNSPAFLSNFLKHCLEPIFLADFWDAIVGAPWDLRMEHVDV